MAEPLRPKAAAPSDTDRNIVKPPINPDLDSGESLDIGPIETRAAAEAAKGERGLAFANKANTNDKLWTVSLDSTDEVIATNAATEAAIRAKGPKRYSDNAEGRAKAKADSEARKEQIRKEMLKNGEVAR